MVPFSTKLTPFGFNENCLLGKKSKTQKRLYKNKFLIKQNGKY